MLCTNNTICADLTTDSNNCGSCGHSCAGGTCSGGSCQALSLGLIPKPYGAQNLVLAGGSLYAITGGLISPSVWQLNPNATSTPVSVASNIAAENTPRCIMNGKVFWAAISTGTGLPTPIMSCSLTNCAATTTTILTSPGQAHNPVCDTSTNELVWDDLTAPYAGADDIVVTIYRAGPDGTGQRTMTSFYDSTGDYPYSVVTGFVSERADRFFFARENLTTATEASFYVSTNSIGVSPVAIASGPLANQFNPSLTAFANDSLLVWNDDGGQDSYGLPLPNGVTGIPTVFYQGNLGGVMDSQNFYGTFGTLPADAVGTCPLSNCSSPTILFRGQLYASAFTQDSAAIYWTTPATGGGSTVWKGAK